MRNLVFIRYPFEFKFKKIINITCGYKRYLLLINFDFNNFICVLLIKKIFNFKLFEKSLKMHLTTSISIAVPSKNSV